MIIKEEFRQYCLETAQQFFKFGIVGAIGFGVDYALVCFAIDHFRVWSDHTAPFFHIEPGLFCRIAAGLFSFPFAVTVTWIGNRRFTFCDAAPMPAAKQLAKFAFVCAIGLVFNRGTYSLLVSTIPLVYDYPVIGLLAGTGAGMFFNFFAARKHVFGC